MNHDIVFVGVGGAGVSAFAQICHALGFNIVGIDNTESEITKSLQQQGIEIILGHGKYEITAGQRVIYSRAVINSPEVQQAVELFSRHIPNALLPLNYFELLGEVSKHFRTIGVAGTNGKSTTTAMTIYTMNKYEPDFALGIVGAMMSDFNQKNFFIPTSKKDIVKKIFEHIFKGKSSDDFKEIIKKYFFVVEACEFQGQFLSLDVDYTLITNVELDHTDYYENIEHYYETFKKYIQKISKKVIAGGYDKSITPLIDGDKEKFTLTEKFPLNMQRCRGDHNICNGSLVIKLCEILGHTNLSEIQHHLEKFHGIRRRLETLGTNKNGAIIISDYGHHPTSLNAVHQAISTQFPNQKITAIFQPHQARRVIEFREGFTNALKKFDKNIVYNIYAARENLEELKKVFHQKDLTMINSIDDLGTKFANESNGKYTTNINEIISIIENAPGNEIIVIMTAGDLDYQIRTLRKK